MLLRVKIGVDEDDPGVPRQLAPEGNHSFIEREIILQKEKQRRRK